MISNVGRYMFAYLQLGLMINLFHYFFNVPSLLVGIGIGISANRIHSINEMIQSPYVQFVVQTIQFGSGLILMNLNTISHGLYIYFSRLYNSYFNSSVNVIHNSEIHTENHHHIHEHHQEEHQEHHEEDEEIVNNEGSEENNENGVQDLTRENHEILDETNINNNRTTEGGSENEIREEVREEIRTEENLTNSEMEMDKKNV